MKKYCVQYRNTSEYEDTALFCTIIEAEDPYKAYTKVAYGSRVVTLVIPVD